MACNILLVEDSSTDAAIIMAAFKSIGYSGKIQIVCDGTEAIDFLEQIGLNHGNDLPQLILLDLNLPRKSGHEMLHDIKVNPIWQAIPVIVFSSSSRPVDIAKSYRLHANAYVVKPIVLEDYRLTAQRICDFWLKTVKLQLE
ncbi:MAG: response regulator [Cyanobacteria bacterium P01_H01_bin.21]